MPTISSSNKSSGVTPEISIDVTQSASEVTNLNQQSPGGPQAVEQSSPRFSEKEVKSRIGELKIANQVRESELRSQANRLPDSSGINSKETLKQINNIDAQAEFMMSSKKMQEMNMSFNMQYLMLQQKMQDESRRFTLLSNIMKTKHDTVKNSVSNVR